MRRWLILAVAGVVVAAGVPAIWVATRPARSAGAPVVQNPAETSRAGASAASPSPADPSSVRSGSPTTGVPVTIAAVPRAAGTGEGHQPGELSIRSLGIDAPIDPVGVDAQGAMQLPADVRRVGWYRFNPAPGAAEGSVVLSGHVDNAKQGLGAMYALRRAAPGDRITIRTQDGATHAYRVTGRDTFVKRRLPAEQLFTTAGPPRLILITCGGPFLPALHSYRDNLVVAAEPI